MLRLSLLGTPLLEVNGTPRPLTSQKALALLGYLAADPGRSFTRAQLCTLLWEQSSERDGRNALSTVLTRLRRALPQLPLRLAADSVQWESGPDRVVDLHAFLAHRRAAATAAAPERRAHLLAAAELYRGQFMDGFALPDSAAHDDWLRDERAGWQQRVLNILNDLVALETADGNLLAAIEQTRRALALDPLQEPLHRTMIQLLAERGDRAAALAHYRTWEQTLARELGVEPDEETTALIANIRDVRVVGAAAPATPRLSARLRAARRQRFVGRQPELALFTAALAQPDPPFLVLHVIGPGGVGKSTLLAEYAALAAAAGVQTLLLDGRNTQPTPEGLLLALGAQLGVADPLAALAERVVLLIDTYEQLAPLERWLCDALLPQLPARALVVLAGRNPPSLIWRADPGWQQLSRVVRLTDLTDAEAADYLAQRGVPQPQQQAVLRLTHGYPLGLSLAADLIGQRPDARLDLLDAPDIVRALLDRFVETVPSPAHRAALEVMGQVRVLDEPLLAALLQQPDAHGLFTWLTGLSFVSTSRRGLFPHDLARQVLDAELRWRNGAWYRTIHNRARSVFLARFADDTPQEQQQALIDLIFLHENPLLRAIFVWNELNELIEDGLRPGDAATVVELVRRHEGDVSAALAAHWLAAQPQGTTVFRDAAGAVQGFNTLLRLRPGDADGGDPCVAAVLRALAAGPALNPDEYALVDRFWLDRDAYQGMSAAQGMIFIASIRAVVTAPGLAASYHVLADPDLWGPAVEAVLFTRLHAADFSVGGRRYAVYTHDWRAQTPAAWFTTLATREMR